ncbi:hypothetical protein MPH_01214 [Macrophomina phaseolina MS6]|uniref:Uncharacterized protein n=1 Tax=Macrophomina phaseolina (strain MS6) TaxID=1126212 RepID=K2S3I5_MACPH|nr:hypothetical protein MPH_01214 [Macrophomina phaseolina MS6]
MTTRTAGIDGTTTSIFTIIPTDTNPPTVVIGTPTVTPGSTSALPSPTNTTGRSSASPSSAPEPAISSIPAPVASVVSSGSLIPPVLTIPPGNTGGVLTLVQTSGSHFPSFLKFVLVFCCGYQRSSVLSSGPKCHLTFALHPKLFCIFVLRIRTFAFPVRTSALLITTFALLISTFALLITTFALLISTFALLINTFALLISTFAFSILPSLSAPTLPPVPATLATVSRPTGLITTLVPEPSVCVPGYKQIVGTYGPGGSFVTVSTLGPA